MGLHLFYIYNWCMGAQVFSIRNQCVCEWNADMRIGVSSSVCMCVFAVCNWSLSLHNLLSIIGVSMCKCACLLCVIELANSCYL